MVDRRASPLQFVDVVEQVGCCAERRAWHIAASPAAVWAVYSRLHEWPDWNPVCVAVRDVSAEPAPWTPGSRFTVVLRMAGVPVPFAVQVAAAEPPHHVTWTSTHLSVTADRTVAFTPHGDGTLVSDTKVFRSPILPLALIYPRPIIHAMGADTLQALKRRVEGT
ncbi:MAG: SRPBCC family protein [Chloroflexi bacterium]|nr:SRPBCC family protein [Chloroflexota bacterium]